MCAIQSFALDYRSYFTRFHWSVAAAQFCVTKKQNSAWEYTDWSKPQWLDLEGVVSAPCQ